MAVVFKSEPQCVVAKVEATENPQCAAKNDIQGFPTIKLFSADGVKDYDSGRDLESLV